MHWLSAANLTGHAALQLSAAGMPPMLPAYYCGLRSLLVRLGRDERHLCVVREQPLDEEALILQRAPRGPSCGAAHRRARSARRAVGPPAAHILGHAEVDARQRSRDDGEVVARGVARGARRRVGARNVLRKPACGPDPV